MRAMLVGGTQVATYDQFKQLYGTLGLSGQPALLLAVRAANQSTTSG